MSDYPCLVCNNLYSYNAFLRDLDTFQLERKAKTKNKNLIKIRTIFISLIITRRTNTLDYTHINSFILGSYYRCIQKHNLWKWRGTYRLLHKHSWTLAVSIFGLELHVFMFHLNTARLIRARFKYLYKIVILISKVDLVIDNNQFNTFYVKRDKKRDHFM